MKNAFLFERRGALRACSAELFLTLAFAPLGCKRMAEVRVQQTEEEGSRMASTVHMGDKRTETQLITGFYGIEEGSWRWTARQFSLVVRPPFGSAQKGATLQARLSVPEPTIAKLKTISISAKVNGQDLPPETYTQPGEYTYTRDVPASLLAGESAKLEFVLDKAMPPAGADVRELGIVALSIGLEPK
jgi:hypothetical protein